MGRASKQKGNQFEREVSNFLSNLYGEKFIRVPNSGAFVGGQNVTRLAEMDENQTRTFKGDIIPSTSLKKLVCEAKSYKEFPFHQLFKSTDIKILDSWIEQVKGDGNLDDIKLIIMKFNRKGRYIMFESKHGFKAPQGIKYKDWTFTCFEQFWNLNKDRVKELSS